MHVHTEAIHANTQQLSGRGVETAEGLAVEVQVEMEMDSLGLGLGLGAGKGGKGGKAARLWQSLSKGCEMESSWS